MGLAGQDSGSSSSLLGLNPEQINQIAGRDVQNSQLQSGTLLELMKEKQAQEVLEQAKLKEMNANEIAQFKAHWEAVAKQAEAAKDYAARDEALRRIQSADFVDQENRAQAISALASAGNSSANAAKTRAETQSPGYYQSLADAELATAQDKGIQILPNADGTYTSFKGGNAYDTGVRAPDSKLGKNLNPLNEIKLKDSFYKLMMETVDGKARPRRSIDNNAIESLNNFADEAGIQGKIDSVELDGRKFYVHRASPEGKVNAREVLDSLMTYYGMSKEGAIKLLEKSRQ